MVADGHGCGVGASGARGAKHDGAARAAWRPSGGAGTVLAAAAAMAARADPAQRTRAIRNINIFRSIASPEAQPRRAHLAWMINFAAVPSCGTMFLFVSSFNSRQSFMLRSVWKTVSSVTGKIVTSVPPRSAP